MQFSTFATLAAALLTTDVSACGIPHSAHYRPSHSRPAISASSTSVATPEPTVSSVSAVVVTSSAAASVSAYPTTLVTLTKTSSTPVEVTPTTTSSSSAAATTTSAPSTGLTTDQQNALDAHNAARSEVGETALEWDDSLAADAQTWATHLISVGSLVHSSDSGEGENLYWQSGSNTPYVNGANAWVAEKSSYSGEAIGDGDFESYGHYTQIVWKSTTKVGMAIATDSNGGTYVVARYSPPGNYIGEKPY